ncbi:Tfp pilus assembly protein FimT/FimU [uncultured Massilia sp.]|uniref:pilus assembly FimT family protein n=1 Tax=uncultured Massilia sp. TaxID=169973 RepID=UPI00259081F6|nr:type II secretion system protein [uncultured Massilia sp.]
MRRLFLPRCAGVTLLETLAVIGIVAALATIAVPSADPANGLAADAVAQEVAQALRFAQREAMRTGAWHAVKLDAASQSVRLYRLRMPNASVEDTTVKVLHPLDRRDYVLSLAGNAGHGVMLAEARFEFDKIGATNVVTFDPAGSPVGVVSTTDVKTLKAGTVRIRRGDQERVLTLAPVTGRVSP